jgi:hypothetical protein
VWLLAGLDKQRGEEMKRFLSGLLLVILAVVLANVVAAEKGAAPPKAKTAPTLLKAGPLVEDITLQGKLTKEDGIKKTKTGDVKFIKYILILADGSQVVVPPSPPVPKKGLPGIDLEPFVGKQVTIVGKGYKTLEKVKCTLRSTASVVEEAPSEAAAPAPTAAATPAPAPAK